MKLTLLFAGCLIFTIIYQVEGGLVKDFFGKVHKTADIVREDVKKVWRPDSVAESSTTAIHDDKNGETSTAAANTPEVKPAEKKESENLAPLSGENKKSDENIPKVEKEEKHEEATTVSTSTSTEKEGRENFKAACATGYGRTPDGRCKPTF
ncbi:growth-blocking peptide, long form-like [Choristoneura fumiferana]|uniref:growth-blocking peptide, long form-like n=1 Tax=Choristoneura fumiferana TaxID=7141 RepID=UPI003D159B36